MGVGLSAHLEANDVNDLQKEVDGVTRQIEEVQAENNRLTEQTINKLSDQRAPMQDELNAYKEEEQDSFKGLFTNVDERYHLADAPIEVRVDPLSVVGETAVTGIAGVVVVGATSLVAMTALDGVRSAMINENATAKDKLIASKHFFNSLRALKQAQPSV